MEQDSWYLILNPQSGGGKGRKLERAILFELNCAGIKFTSYKTSFAGDAIAATSCAIRNGFKKILVAGGDGTLNEVVNGILSQDAKPSEDILLAQIPIGTGNDWRRTWGIPKSIKESIAILQNPKTTMQDVAKIIFNNAGVNQEKWFLNIAGCGFDAEVTLAANQKKAKGQSGFFTYIFQLIKTLKQYKEPRMVFEIDSEKFEEDIFAILAGVCRYAGNSMLLVPDADPRDGVFHLTIAKKIKRTKVIRNLHRLFNGSFVNLEEVSVHECKRLQINTADLPIQADGESIGETPAMFEIFEKKLHVVIHTDNVLKKSN
jgi:YegS/Rv2252/BmrU family lipid kinase